MRLFGKLTKRANFWPLLIVVVFAIFAGRTLIFQSGYFNMHDDLQMMRQLEMEKCLFDGQIPCRWVPDMGYGYGFPLFNFYPPLPYIVGIVFRSVGFTFVDTAKLLFALSFVISGVAMYLLAKEFFGRLGGTLSSIFYIWAPYHSVDVYVRGAMNEAWALCWFPLILWSSYRLILQKKKPLGFMITLSLSWVMLLLSHNLMVMIFTPVFVAWCLMFWLKTRDVKKIYQFLLSGALALLLAAFFTIPAVLEQKYIHVDTLTQGYYEYIAHFATIGQLLTSRFWGYGPSVWGPPDSMPFSVGHAHWILSLVVMGMSLIFFGKGKSKKDLVKVVGFGFAVGWFASFMAHQNSTFIWQKINPLAFVQFPWRFLTLAILGMSFMAGAIFVYVPKKLRKSVFILLVGAVLALNWNYFLPQHGKMGPLTDREKFTGAAWDLQRTAGIFDYLPNTAKENPKDPPVVLAEVLTGKGEIVNPQQGTNWAKLTADLGMDSTLRIGIFQFPGWTATVDGTPTKIYVPDTEKWGRMYIDVPSGKHEVDIRLVNTPIRSYSNTASLLGWILVLPVIYWKRKTINERLV